jgi:hypothetical protein
MLIEIYKEALFVMQERASPTTVVYCGWGTTIEEMVSTFCNAGGSCELVCKVLNLAYYK